MDCQCSKKEERLKELQELEKQFENAKATVAYLQCSIATYNKLIQCDCGDECECSQK